jgi:PPOX class probable FMN-dependent enzyme
MPFDNVIRTPGELAELYNEPSEGVRTKAIATFDEHCRAFIARSPFVLVATSDADGRCDVSPRGGAPGFVSVLDDSRLVIPDASGNNRLDTVRNIVQSGRAGLLFLIPGMAETLRINGRACISRDRSYSRGTSRRARRRRS